MYVCYIHEHVFFLGGGASELLCCFAKSWELPREKSVTLTPPTVYLRSAPSAPVGILVAPKTGGMEKHHHPSWLEKPSCLALTS